MLPVPRPSLLRRAATLLASLLTLSLSGCFLPSTHAVNKTVIAPVVMEASLQQLIDRMNAQYNAIQTLSATADIGSSTGGARQGQVKQNPTLTGYILLRKPADLRMILLAPVLRSRAIDMVSDGKNFKLLITPPTSAAHAIVGPEQLATPSRNGLENLRPNIIRDALLVPAVQPDEYVDLTRDSRILAPARGHKEAIEEPDYDLAFFRVPGDHTLQRVRVVHISRATLLPYEQDIYDQAGHVVTIVRYDKYQRFGDVDFPMFIEISRPLDEYDLKLTFSKVTLNQKLDDEQFTLKIPDTIPTRTM